MKETENIESYLARGQYLRDQLTQCNSAIENEEYIGLVLNGLPTTYSGIRMHMKATGLEKITLEEFRNDLKAQEDELKVVEIGSKLENACISRAKGSGKPEKEPYYRNQKPKNIVTCWVCNKKGHYAKYCWHRPGKKLERDESQKQKQENDGEKVNSANESIRSHESAMNVTKKSDDIDCARWYLDSGATSHMTHNKHVFIELNNTQNEVKMADGNSIKVEATGVVRVKITNSNCHYQYINVNVLYVPDIKENLFSISAFEKKGFKAEFKAGMCEIRRDDGTLMMTGKRVNNLYEAEIKIPTNELTNLSTAKEEVMLSAEI